MRHAVHGAEAPDKVAGIDGYDFSRGKKRRQNVQRNAIVGIVEHRHEHDAIRNIKIGVAGRQAPLLEDDRAGHRDLDYV